jgi:transposase
MRRTPRSRRKSAKFPKKSDSWSLKGERKTIKTYSGKHRVTVVGSLDPNTLDLTTTFPEKADSESLCKPLKKLRIRAGDCEKIYAILDNGSYCRSFEVRTVAADLNIELVYLPPYSPHLNLIERLWKLMNEQVRNNVAFASANEFTDAIKDFDQKKWAKIKTKHQTRFAENFQSFA